MEEIPPLRANKIKPSDLRESTLPGRTSKKITKFVDKRSKGQDTEKSANEEPVEEKPEN